MTFFKLTAAIGIMALAACSDTDTTGGPTAADLQGSFNLVDIDGAPITGSATLEIEGARLGGQGPCNVYGADNMAEWPAVDLGPIAVTRRACIDMTGEAIFLNALEQVDKVELGADGLTLSGPDHVMRFSPA